MESRCHLESHPDSIKLTAMILEKGHLYHIYNQGNNRQRIFLERANYLFFLEKIRNHVLPYADLLAWCLMPNHFHLMVQVNEEELPVLPSQGATPLGRDLESHPDLAAGFDIQLQSQRDLGATGQQTRSFQQSIGIMLASYTRAINKRNNWSGSLFRKQTKAICLSCSKTNVRAWVESQGITVINIQPLEMQYPNVCFNYINFNPVKDHLVKQCEDWEFSSYADIKGLRNGKLINRAKIEELGLVLL